MIKYIISASPESEVKAHHCFTLGKGNGLSNDLDLGSTVKENSVSGHSTSRFEH